MATSHPGSRPARRSRARLPLAAAAAVLLSLTWLAGPAAAAGGLADTGNDTPVMPLLLGAVALAAAGAGATYLARRGRRQPSDGSPGTSGTSGTDD